MKIVVALYNFEGDCSFNELRFIVGDEIEVINDDSNDGWLEGKLKRTGDIGLLPKSYVEEYNENIPKPPPPPALYIEKIAKLGPITPVSPHPSIPLPPPSPSPHPNFPPPPLSPPLLGSIPVPPPPPPQVPLPPSPSSPLVTLQEVPRSTAILSGFDESDVIETVEFDHDIDWSQPSSVPSVPSAQALTQHHVKDQDSKSVTSSFTSKKLTRAKPGLKLFSSFAAKGGEAYLFNNEITPFYNHWTKIDLVDSRPEWIELENPVKYDLSIMGFSKENNIANVTVNFHISDQNSESVVKRSYKSFEWLHKVLSDKYTFLSKQDDYTLRKKTAALERWLRLLAQHPLISTSEAFKHFVTCAQHDKWKRAKRAVEKDPLIAQRMMQTIKVECHEMVDVGDEVESRKYLDFILNMKQRLVIFIESFAVFGSLAKSNYNAFFRLGNGFKKFALGKNDDEIKWCWRDECEECSEFSDFLISMGETMQNIAALYIIESDTVYEPIVDAITEFDGLADCGQLAPMFHQKTADKLRFWKKKVRNNTMSTSDLCNLASNCKSLAAMSLAEINHFHKVKQRRMKEIMSVMLEGQLKFHKDMISKLEDVKQMLEKL